MSQLKSVGGSPSRIDGLDKVTGAANYVDDLAFGPDLLHAEIVESPYAHALIKSIDTSAAEKVPGVVRVVTGKDFPYRFGLYMQDRFIFPTDRVRFVGEQVAAVVARDAKTAKRAAKLVKVVYKELKPVLDLTEALRDDAVLVHPDLGKYPRCPWFFPQAGTNIAHFRKTRKGDIEQGFKEADVILEDTYTVPRYAHCAIEPHAIVGLYDLAGRLTLWSASQSPYTQRHVFAQALAPLGLTHKDIRVVTPYVGGGFGGKAGVSMEIIGAALAIMVKGHPVKVRWSRAQEFYNTYQRQGVIARIKLGAKKDGTITAIEHSLHWDAGGYVEYGANVVNAVGLSATGPYRVPNVKIDSVCVYTNLPPGGPYRGFGYSEFHFGLESHMDRLARKLGMDPVEFRRKNAIREGDTLAYGAKMNPSGLHEAIDRVAAEIRWGQKESFQGPQQGHRQGLRLLLEGARHAAQCRVLRVHQVQRGRQPEHQRLGHGDRPGLPDRDGPDRRGGAHGAGQPDTGGAARHRPQCLRVADRRLARDLGLRQRRQSRRARRARARCSRWSSARLGLPRDTLYLEDEKVKCRARPDFELPFKDFVISGIQTPHGNFLGGPILGSGVFMPEFTSALSDPETSQGGHPERPLHRRAPRRPFWKWTSRPAGCASSRPCSPWMPARRSIPAW